MSGKSFGQLHSCFCEYVRGIANRVVGSFNSCMTVSFVTDTGLVREQNEDSFYISGKLRHTFGSSECGEFCEPCGSPRVFGLFDGMGGEAFGEAASEIAAQTLEEYTDLLCSVPPEQLPELMHRYADSANCAIIDMLTERLAEGGGSTFTVIVVRDGVAYPFYIGDSRIYLYRGGALTQLSRDQTLAQFLVDCGRMTCEQAERSYESHVLTSYLGEDSRHNGLAVQCCEPVKLESGTALMMCSDGLSDMCSRSDMEEILASGGESPARRLADRALENGGYDNVTVVTVAFSDKK